jgi:hypothetical protein
VPAASADELYATLSSGFPSASLAIVWRQRKKKHDVATCA